MISRATGALLALALLAGCARGAGRATTTPGPRGGGLPPVADAGRTDRDWATAQRLYRRGNFAESEKLFTRLGGDLRPGDERLPYARFQLGESLFGQGLFLQSAREFRRVSDDLASHPLAPDALLRVGDAYAELWRKPELDPTYGQTAIGSYQELLNRFPGTPAAARGQRRLAELQDRLAVKAYRAARFYLRFKAYDSAILYLKDVVATYPRSSVAPTALVDLVLAYQKLGYKEDIAETCGYMRRFHAAAPRVQEVCAGVVDQPVR
ncbi:MAG: outer membrane protein assembly factor BamD [Gemmatimonadales bacterium]|nr:outer membrane protein assembly factor BamD [Gemmatimonadales bacterium]